MGNSALDPYDFIGIGFGPSNLALAVAAEELDPSRKFAFFEQSPELRWHPGMMIEGSRMQISFLKDLATLRNPASPYTFLQYARDKGLLEKFVNLNEFRLTRLEYQDYLRWVVASSLPGDLLARVTRVAPADRPGEGAAAVPRRGGERRDRRARHPLRRECRLCRGRPGPIPRRVRPRHPGVIHSSEFLSALPTVLPDRSKPYDIAVAGDGQSVDEIAYHLLENFPKRASTSA